MLEKLKLHIMKLILDINKFKGTFFLFNSRVKEQYLLKLTSSAKTRRFSTREVPHRTEKAIREYPAGKLRFSARERDYSHSADNDDDSDDDDDDSDDNDNDTVGSRRHMLLQPCYNVSWRTIALFTS